MGFFDILVRDWRGMKASISKKILLPSYDSPIKDAIIEGLSFYDAYQAGGDDSKLEGVDVLLSRIKSVKTGRKEIGPDLHEWVSHTSATIASLDSKESPIILHGIHIHLNPMQEGEARLQRKPQKVFTAGS